MAVQPAKPRAAPSCIYLDRFDDFLQVVTDLDGTVGVAGPAHAALTEDLVERLRVGAMIRDRRRRVFELMPGEHTHDALTWLDHALLAQPPQAGDARCRRGFAAQPSGAHLR